MYVVAPNMGTYYLFPEEKTPIDTFGGRSYIINYRGQIVGRQDYGAGSTYVAGLSAPLREADLSQEPLPQAGADEAMPSTVIKRQIKLMHDRGIWKKPGR